MSEKKILILGAGNAQRDAIEILNKEGYETYSCAMNDSGPGAKIAKHFEIINIVDYQNVKEYVIKNAIDVVYSVGSDIAMPVACKISEELNLPFFVTESTAINCNSKNNMRNELGSDFVGNTQYQVIESINEVPDIPYPYILKPSDSQGQRGVYLINSVKEFKKHFSNVKNYSRSGKVIAEQYINGPEISVNLYVVNGEIKFFMPSDRITWPKYTGLIHEHHVPSKVITDEIYNKLYLIVDNALKEMKIYNGPAYFQMKIEDSNPYIIEMTPRLDGCHMWKLIEYYTGVNLLKLTLNHLLLNDTTELNEYKHNDSSYKLEFYCQEPETVMEKGKFIVPNESLTHLFYCETGEIVPNQNGKFEKVGYFIQNIEENNI